MRNSDLAKALGAAPAQISQWSRRGMPTTDAQSAAAWRATHIRPRRKRNGAAKAEATGGIRQSAAPPDPAVANWRDRRERAVALLTEIELDTAQGRHVPVEEVAKAAEARETLIRSRLRAIVPTRVRPMLQGRLAPALAHSICAEVSRAITELLIELKREGK